MLSAILVLWPELAENLPGKPLQGHLFYCFLLPGNLIPSFVSRQTVSLYVYMHILTKSHVGLLL